MIYRGISYRNIVRYLNYSIYTVTVATECPDSAQTLQHRPVFIIDSWNAYWKCEIACAASKLLTVALIYISTGATH